MKNKVILIDTSGLFFPCVFAWERQKKTANDRFVLPSHTMYFNTLLSCLKKIGVNPQDTIIMACEGHSWRKDVYTPYKAQREEQREKHELIDWDYQFKKLNELHESLDKATIWHFIRDWKCAEADDVIAIACRYYEDKECIVVTGDKDLYQLAYYPNVKIFSVNKKCKGTKGCYDEVPNPLKIIADKARKGDISDNILPSPNDTEEDYNLRYQIVNLLELPEEVENSIISQLENLSKKEQNLDNLPEFKNVREKFLQIYKKEKIVTYEYCKELLTKREERKKKKLTKKRRSKNVKS